MGGYCWYWADNDASCTDACSTHGGANLEGLLWAGTGAANADNCTAVLDVLEVTGGPAVDFGCSIGWGCAIRRDFMSNRFWNRCVDTPTTAEGSSFLITRVCACND